MRIHHLNCISTCPVGGSLMDGQSVGSLRGRLACHCLLVEAGSELILVDTGFGLQDVRHPKERLSRVFLTLLRPELREELTAVRQIAALGFDPRDVRHIVLTHLDFDHAGGLSDFPDARVHLLSEEKEAAFARLTMLDRMRYRPAQWPSEQNFRTYRGSVGQPWFGFECVRDLDGVPPEILLVPLIGHTLGHAGVAVACDGRWMLLAGDAYFYRDEMNVDRPRCTPGLRLYQRMMEKDRAARLYNQRRLRHLRRAHEGECTIFCSHDVDEFRHLAGRALDVPAGRFRPSKEHHGRVDAAQPALRT